MRKILTVAASEFQTAIQSKGFLVGLAIMPVLILGSIGAQKVAGDRIDREERTVAVIDHTSRVYPLLEAAAVNRNAGLVKNGVVTGPRFTLERAEPTPGRPLDELKLELSQRVRDERLFAFVEIPADALDKGAAVPYYTSNQTYETLPRWLGQALSSVTILERSRDNNVDLQAAVALIRPVQLNMLSLLERDASGRILEARKVDTIRSFVTPMVLMLLMFTIVISIASPLMNSVMEEKMTRISEVLLGSVTPFELMLGKLAGVVGVSLVLAAVYLAGAYGIATYYGYGDAVSAVQFVWFAVYLVLAMILYGSLFIAIGAAATDLKDAQGLMTPVMILFMAPMFIWLPVLRAPGSSTAIVASLVPFATPVLMTLRLGLEPKPAAWQIAASFLMTAATTVLLVWAAGRIFRVGILMQGKSASFGEMIRWIRVR